MVPGSEQTSAEGVTPQTIPGSHYDKVTTTDGDTITRYQDFLFVWSTMPYNMAGVFGAHSLFLQHVVKGIAGPFGSLVDVLKAAGNQMVQQNASTSGEFAGVNYPQSSEHIDTLRKDVRFSVMHSPILSPSKDEELFGRGPELQQLTEALRAPSSHQYYVILGAPGLGKTALVESAGRALVASGGSRFTSIVFVELRAKDTPALAFGALDEAVTLAGMTSREQLRDALVILDNTDDPYTVSYTHLTLPTILLV